MIPGAEHPYSSNLRQQGLGSVPFNITGSLG